MKTDSEDWSDQHARRAMWEDFFHRRCPTKRDVINSAVSALVLREAECAELRERLSECETALSEAEAQRDGACAEVRRLRIYVRDRVTCQCSDKDACRFVMERNEARAEVRRLRRARTAEEERADVVALLRQRGSHRDDLRRRSKHRAHAAIHEEAADALHIAADDIHNGEHVGAAGGEE